MQLLDTIDTAFVYFGVFGRKFIVVWIVFAMLINTAFLRYSENRRFWAGLIPGLSTVFYTDLYVNIVLCIFSTLLSGLVFFVPSLAFLIPFYIVTSFRNKAFMEGALPEYNAIVGGWVPFMRYYYELTETLNLARLAAIDEDSDNEKEYADDYDDYEDEGDYEY